MPQNVFSVFDHLEYNSIKNSLNIINFNSITKETLIDLLLGRQVALNTPQGPATLPQHRGCPLGSCTGPAFWRSLVANEVLTQSWPEGVHLQAFTNDFIFLIKAPTEAKVKSLANEALNQFKSWTAKHNLEISADKSNYMHLIKNRNGSRWSAVIRWEVNLLKRKSSIKYLGVFIDDKLNFATHLSELKDKTLIPYQKIKSIAASKWGLNKNIRRKIYFTVIERILLYGAPAWANNITSRQQRLLNSIQRKFLLNIAGAYSSTPTAALQVIEGITPLHIKAQMEYILVRVGRLRRDYNWEGSSFLYQDFQQLNPPLIIHPANFDLEDRVSIVSDPHPQLRLFTQMVHI
ncbi:Putative protein in type-1 retrotransposable element R1DM [Araneus ventricosus]|uniref:Reverse transcriptase domain-containing protein n=1 Tax=Araneus ventricosus TaxID=182803 RepID=A0A4Y2CQ80_ARAVE|nr:Putative protein in type-1 retrotransposable element R1DM [Araneus ventricosus]